MYTRTKLHIPGANFEMGDLVRGEITGFEGIVTTHMRHLTGCDTVWVQSQTEKHEGKNIERHFDVIRMELKLKNPLGIQGFPDDVPAAG